MSEIDRYVADLSAHLRVGGRTRSRILAEVRDHLEDAVAKPERDAEHPELGFGVTPVFDDFGAPSVIATQFNAEAGTRGMRRAPVAAFLAGAGVFGGFLLAGTTQPHSATPANATLMTQVAFFVAVLAFEIAVVAGFCAASRALAVWPVPIAGASDRQYVRGCALVATGALCVATAAWVATMALALDRLISPNTATLAAGGALMAASAGIAVATVWSSPVNVLDDAPDEPEPASRVFLLGERSIARVREHPVLSCVAAAGLSAIPAMSHAETTLSGALPWGLTQAASAVLGFVVLGPALGLRSRKSRIVV